MTGVSFSDTKQNGGNGQDAGTAGHGGVGGGGGGGSSSSSSSRSKIDPHAYALQAAFSSKGFHVPKRTLSKLANQRPDGSSSERRMRVSRSVSAAKK